MSAATPVAALLVDVRPVDHPTARHRGIGRYTAGLLGGLSRVGAPVVGLYDGDAEAARAREEAPGLALRRWDPAVVGEHAAPGAWYLATQLMLHPVSLDPIPSAITAAGLPVAAVMYDVIPYRHAEHYQREPSARALAEMRVPLARTVDAMLAISQFSLDTAADELDFPAERMRMIGAGVDRHFVRPEVHEPPWPARLMERGDAPYVVAVTGGDERKNTEGLLRAWAQADLAAERPASGRRGARPRLVIATAASAPVLDRWRRVADGLGIAEDVDITGHVTDDEMVALLQHARLAVLPSLEEGFGLPVLEAAACGCPAICSGTSSLPEVLDEPSAWFDPADPASIARAIERGVGDEDHRVVLVEAGRRAVARFNWERVATDTVAALAELGPRWPMRLRPPARRLAIVGVDDAVVAALRRAPSPPRLDVLVDHCGAPDPTGPDRHPARALGRYAKAWDYDDVVVALDPERSCPASVELSALPCHVWLLAPGAAMPSLGRARSVIVPDESTASAVGERRPDGPPIMVLPSADTDVPADAEPTMWSADHVARELLAWIADVDDLPAGTIRRLPADPT